MKRLILYAPGVHTGGGLVLLQGLLAQLSVSSAVLLLDSRCFDCVKVPAGTKVCWCSPSILGRLKAEYLLRTIAAVDDTVLCFHGLPPFLPNKGNVAVFVQNRLNLSTKAFAIRSESWRSNIKRFLFALFSRHASRFIVQTRSMYLGVKRTLGDKTVVRILPFVDSALIDAKSTVCADKLPDFDFIYVADGQPHKNHETLLNAWVLLAEEGIRPSLVLTLGSRDQTLIDKVVQVKKKNNLHIENVRELDRNGVFDLYKNARALIFPSVGESFGLPLLEATKCGLPVVTAELDYVRDVCVPVETFDPTSAVSIVRAVKRFLGYPESVETLISVRDFLDKVLEQ